MEAEVGWILLRAVAESDSVIFFDEFCSSVGGGEHV